MLNLHLKFRAENNTSNISYPAFCQLRPFGVVHPSLSDRKSCQCKLHEKLGFLAEKLKVIETANLERLVELVCCDVTSKSCMYGECGGCKSTVIPLSNEWSSECKEGDLCSVGHRGKGSQRRELILENNDDKKKLESSQDEIVERFNTHLTKFRRHLFNIRQQFAFSHSH